MTNTWYRKLQAMGACEDAVEWAKSQPSFAVAWRKCTRPDWMLWLLPNIGAGSRKLVEIACAIAESVEGNSMDPRVSACNRMTREWLAGKASSDQLSAAESAAWDAASAAESAVESAAWDAASAARAAESAARAAESAASAAWAAARSARSARSVWNAESAWNVESAARGTQADIIRAHFPKVTLPRKIAR